MSKIKKKCLKQITNILDGDNTWKNMHREKNIYAPNINMSMFKKDYKWDINNLPTLLLEGLDEPVIDGVTSSYLYLGAQNSFFAIHCEDSNLQSILLLHRGAPKIWIIVPPVYAEKFETTLKLELETKANSQIKNMTKCPAFLRHKRIFVTPKWLGKNDIPYQLITQTENTIVLTMSRAYHEGE